jgi:phosphotriesterase-related protein
MHVSDVNSVLGSVDPSALGFTLCHEHVVVGSAGIQQTYPELFDRAAVIEEGVRRLTEARAEGVQTIIDLTPMELGRDIRLLEEVSQRSGVQIIAATGTYVDIPRFMWFAEPDRWADVYVREIEEGIEGTGIKAGVIKTANNEAAPEPKEVSVIRGVARAHLRTGIPISTHTHPQERSGAYQVRILQEEGVDMSRVCIGHSNDTTDLDYLRGLLQSGVYLGMDTYPWHGSPPTWEDRTATAKALIDEGYAGQLMFSHDWSIKRDPDDSWGSNAEAHQTRNPDGYLFVTRRVLPRLREMGVSDDTINQMMVENPRRFFER